VTEEHRAIVIGGFITYSLFVIIMLFSISGALSGFVWLNIALYLLLALGFGYFTLVKQA
jgi:hypothetical protein